MLIAALQNSKDTVTQISARLADTSISETARIQYTLIHLETALEYLNPFVNGYSALQSIITEINLLRTQLEDPAINETAQIQNGAAKLITIQANLESVNPAAPATTFAEIMARVALLPPPTAPSWGCCE